MGNQGKILRKQGSKMHVFLPFCFRSDFKFDNETHTVCGVTSFQGLPVSECCGRTNFFTVKTK